MHLGSEVFHLIFRRLANLLGDQQSKGRAKRKRQGLRIGLQSSLPCCWLLNRNASYGCINNFQNLKKTKDQFDKTLIRKQPSKAPPKNIIHLQLTRRSPPYILIATKSSALEGNHTSKNHQRSISSLSLEMAFSEMVVEACLAIPSSERLETNFDWKGKIKMDQGLKNQVVYVGPC